MALVLPRHIHWPDFQTACADLLFLHHPSKPIAPRPVAKSGSAAGSGVAATSTTIKGRSICPSMIHWTMVASFALLAKATVSAPHFALIRAFGKTRVLEGRSWATFGANLLTGPFVFFRATLCLCEGRRWMSSKKREQRHKDQSVHFSPQKNRIETMAYFQVGFQPFNLRYARC